MELLEPVPVGDIPIGRSAKYDSIREKALSLNGLALPVEFETKKEASSLASGFRQPRGKGKRLGLIAVLRGKTVFIYKQKRPS